jgi:hypothetical protein
MKKRIGIGLLLPIAVAAALLTAGASSAATGTIGSYQPAQASCLNGRILVTSPLMDSVPVSYGSNVIVIGSSHTQWVAYRAWVYHVESRQWIAGSWKARQAGNDGYSSLFDGSWYDYNARGWAGSSTDFTINLRGTYYVYVQYYWFADQYVGAGSDGGFISVNDYNNGGLGTTAACQF